MQWQMACNKIGLNTGDTGVNKLKTCMIRMCTRARV